MFSFLFFCDLFLGFSIFSFFYSQGYVLYYDQELLYSLHVLDSIDIFIIYEEENTLLYLYFVAISKRTNKRITWETLAKIKIAYLSF